MSIKQLPQDVVDRIKSSVTITSLNEVAIGLLKNSLDAGSTKANIQVDYSRGNCTVEDDGTGILPGDFHPDGGLCKLHNSSHQSSTAAVHGKDGMFLASLANLSLLFIVSHHQQHASQNSVFCRNGQVISRGLPCLPEHRIESFDHGTRIVVRDLFGSMPVRLKHRAKLASDRSYLDREWFQLIHHSLALMLIWPTETVVVLKDLIMKREVRLKSVASRDVIPRTMQLLAQSGVTGIDEAELWTPVSATSGGVAVRGCICLEPSASKSHQFLSLGIHPIKNQYGSNALYEEVNKVFSNSSFGTIEDDGLETFGDGGGIENLATSKLRVRKGLERWPVYNLQIHWSGPTKHLDLDSLMDDHPGDISSVLSLLRAVCYGFLKKHHLRPHKVPIAVDKSVFSTQTKLASRNHSKKQNSNADSSSRRQAVKSIDSGQSISPFEDWQLIKVGHATTTKPPREHQPNTFAEPLIGEGGKLLRKPFNDISTEEAEAPMAPKPARPVSLATSPSDDPPLKAVKAEHMVGSENKRRFLDKRSRPEPSPWLQDILQSYENPVFNTTQPLIHQASEENSTNTQGRAGGMDALRGTDHDILFETGASGLSGSITRDALAKARVITQVDRKFILVKLPLSQKSGQEAKSALIMVDQHAADERIKLEGLMAGYFETTPSGSLRPVIENLLKPITAEVSIKEGELLTQQRAYFASWGIIYQIPSMMNTNPAKNTTTCLQITALPPAILERCRTETRLLIDLIRKDIWMLYEEGKAPNRPGTRLHSSSSNSKPWVANFHGCPRGILDLLHSRSCRSAIMFNDALTLDECKTLVENLAECAFPFQCAHGRPSMVPLFDLGSGPRMGGWAGDQQVTELAQWKRQIRYTID